VATLALTVLLATGAAAQLRFEGQEDEDLPIDITSDHMEADNKTSIVVFSGNVVSVRGRMTVKADRMRVFNSQEGRRVEKIIWTGNVDFEMDEQHATADKAIFMDAEQTLTLTGNPEAWENDNRIVGEEMILYLREDKSVVKGSSERRIHVTLYPESVEEQASESEAATASHEEAKEAEEPTESLKTE